MDSALFEFGSFGQVIKESVINFLFSASMREAMESLALKTIYLLLIHMYKKPCGKKTTINQVNVITRMTKMCLNNFYVVYGI